MYCEGAEIKLEDSQLTEMPSYIGRSVGMENDMKDELYRRR